MILAGAIVTIIGFSLLWLTPYVGGVVMAAGLTVIWVSEDQRIKRKNQIRRIEEETEAEFDILKYDEPTSAKVFELATLVYGSLKPYEAWLLDLTTDLENWYSKDRDGVLEEVKNHSSGKYKNLFAFDEKYQNICEFLKTDPINEIVEDLPSEDDEKKLNSSDAGVTFDQMLGDYDFEEWLKKRLKNYVSEGLDRTSMIKKIKTDASNELGRDIAVSCVNEEWIINGEIKIKL
tara:strand:+ start:173 stop:871 length:699 start_codon:yes stop_codon:yes gene_type:complete